MIIPIKCPGCGKPTGHLWEKYIELVKNYRENSDDKEDVESTDKSHMLYVDSENNKVGIGAGAEPGEALEVVGNISASGTVTANAFVGDITGTLTGTALF